MTMGMEDENRQKLSEVIGTFNTPPYLFIGSGISRRYLNIPTWEDLLKTFVSTINPDPFAYTSYLKRAERSECSKGILPKVAELLQDDFDDRWFADPSIRKVDQSLSQYIINTNCSPFKAEVSYYLRSFTEIIEKYLEEIGSLRMASEKNLAGIITTNYDCFLEKVMEYCPYIGQENLLFSAIQGFAEIYKIHGCVSDPQSIVITQRDYLDFSNKKAYLSAKLLTLFVEHPIIFLGYSLEDKNIQEILETLVAGLSKNQVSILQSRLIFVEWNPHLQTVKIEKHTAKYGDVILTMTKIEIEDFGLIFNQLLMLKNRIPVKLLRRFKEDVYKFAVTNEPSTTIQVANFDDLRVGNDDLVLAVGTLEQLGDKGLIGITLKQWYQDIVLGDLNVSADRMLSTVYHKLLKENRTSPIPVYKYLAESTIIFEKIIAETRVDFDSLLNNGIRLNRANRTFQENSIRWIWNTYGDTYQAFDCMAMLYPVEINLAELEEILRLILTRTPSPLVDFNPNYRTSLRRLIKIYDYIKYYEIAIKKWDSDTDN